MVIESPDAESASSALRAVAGIALTRTRSGRIPAISARLWLRSILAKRDRMASIIPQRLSVHVIRRGNNRGPIFVDDYDREMFLTLLEATSNRHAVDVHAYVLMSNHYHTIVTPPDRAGLTRMLRDLGREYVLRYNARHSRIGTLWTGKPRRIPIADERYWLTCLRYVEQNPVRAHVVADAADYPWSTYRFHALGEPSHWLVRHPVYEALGSVDVERQQVYRALFSETLTTAEVVRQHVAWPTMTGRDGDRGTSDVGRMSTR
jgi:putative transposase